MTSFVSSEQRLASAAFDAYIEHVNTTLRDPVIAATLGALATDLLRTYNTAFLPNFESGAFRIPKKQANSENLPLVPLTDEQADRAFELTGPLFEGPPITAWPADIAVTSKRYGLTLPEELESMFQEGLKGEANSPAHPGLRPGTLARTQARLLKSDTTYAISRPSVMIRSSLLLDSEPPAAYGALLAHEGVHVLDLFQDGPIYGTLAYGGASELRAYNVSAEVYRAAGIDTPESKNSIEIDTLRQQEIGNSPYPFTPNQRLIDALLQRGAL